MGSVPLAQSADKQVLFTRLNLTEQIHKILLQEAHNIRDSLSREPLHLNNQLAANPPQIPYKWDEISETARHRAILLLVNNTPPDTRYYYVLGRYHTNVNEENWVARWYLWHSFRYRDNKDARCRVTRDSGIQTSGDSPASFGSASASGNDNGSSYWDPARNEYR